MIEYSTRVYDRYDHVARRGVNHVILDGDTESKIDSLLLEIESSLREYGSVDVLIGREPVDGMRHGDYLIKSLGSRRIRGFKYVDVWCDQYDYEYDIHGRSTRIRRPPVIKYGLEVDATFFEANWKFLLACGAIALIAFLHWVS